MKKACALIVFIGVFLYSAIGTSVKTEDSNEDGKPDRWIEARSDSVIVIKSDRNFDGDVDHVLEIDDAALKIQEFMDFNFDGTMDDFSYFARGVLQRREIDTNFDDVIDIWVYMHKGVYVKRVERDNDYDGEIDYVKDYDSP